MTYTQPSIKILRAPDKLNRKVLLAVELMDPLAQSLVSRGVIVKAKGLDGGPIVSWSGRFVWLEENGKWPEEISVVPVRLPFESETVVPAPPADLAHATPAERLVRITLRPTPAYDLSVGVTAIRGQLCERTDQPSSPAVRDAIVQLAWHEIHANEWLPKPPPLPQDVVTNAKGEFAAFLRLTPTALQSPDVVTGLLKVRLQFTRGGSTRVTPDDFPFLADPASKGRVSEGQLLLRDLKLGWADLPPI